MVRRFFSSEKPTGPARRRRTVVIVRRGLLLGAILLMAGVFGWPLLQPASMMAGSGGGPAQRDEEAPHNHADKPRYQSVDARGQPYTITADSALQDHPTSGTYRLVTPYAEMTLRDTSRVTVTSEKGVYHETDQRLDLSRAVTVSYGDAYVLKTSALTMYAQQGAVEGHHPVVGTGPAGTINAEGIRVMDRGQTLFFTGKTRLVLSPSVPDASADTAHVLGK